MGPSTSRRQPGLSFKLRAHSENLSALVYESGLSDSGSKCGKGQVALAGLLRRSGRPIARVDAKPGNPESEPRAPRIGLPARRTVQSTVHTSEVKRITNIFLRGPQTVSFRARTHRSIRKSTA